MSEMTAPEPATPATPREAELEERIRKLESVLAERAGEAGDDALADRVIARLTALASEPRALANAERVVVLESGADGRALVAVPPPPDGAVLEPPPPANVPDPARRRWFLTQLWSEIRLAFAMYFDPRYRISRTTQFAIPGIGLLLIFNYFFFSVWVSVAFLSPVIERLLGVLLGILGYMLLTREIARYRDVLAYLAKYPPR
jgi:hypothetical protein